MNVITFTGKKQENVPLDKSNSIFKKDDHVKVTINKDIQLKANGYILDISEDGNKFTVNFESRIMGSHLFDHYFSVYDITLLESNGFKLGEKVTVINCGWEGSQWEAEIICLFHCSVTVLFSNKREECYLFDNIKKLEQKSMKQKSEGIVTLKVGDIVRANIGRDDNKGIIKVMHPYGDLDVAYVEFHFPDEGYNGDYLIDKLIKVKDSTEKESMKQEFERTFGFQKGDRVTVRICEAKVSGEIVSTIPDAATRKALYVKFDEPYTHFNGYHSFNVIELTEKIQHLAPTIKPKEENSMKKDIEVDYITRQKQSGFKKGDKVKILRNPKNQEDGWLGVAMPEDYYPNLEKNFIKPFKIKADCGEMGFLIDLIAIDSDKQSYTCHMPYFVLEKAVPKPVKVVDLPANCWIRSKSNTPWVFKILSIDVVNNAFTYGMYVVSGISLLKEHDFKDLEWAETPNAEKWNPMVVEE